mmetsp:Transcript_99537/g.177226  ORF Transcript_99537/g.177226 Transcript_99537/m.177226 type:complete len:96 (+) Transcript_99537:78-365(+)
MFYVMQFLFAVLITPYRCKAAKGSCIAMTASFLPDKMGLVRKDFIELGDSVACPISLDELLLEASYGSVPVGIAHCGLLCCQTFQSCLIQRLQLC